MLGPVAFIQAAKRRLPVDLQHLRRRNRRHHGSRAPDDRTAERLAARRDVVIGDNVKKVA